MRRLDPLRLWLARRLHFLSLRVCPPDRDFDIRDGENLRDYFERKVKESRHLTIVGDEREP